MKDIKNWTGTFDAAQTNKQLGSSLVTADQRIAIVYLEAINSASSTANVSALIGFAATTLPTITVNASAGAAGFALNHGGIAPGSGKVSANGGEAIAVGEPGIHPLLTCSVPTGGDLRIIMAYILIDAEVVA